MGSKNQKEKTKKVKVEMLCNIIEFKNHYKLILPDFNKIKKLDVEIIW